MALHNEIEFENEICEYLGTKGWLYEPKAADDYDRKLTLYPPDAIAWVKETQPAVWDSLLKNHGQQAETRLLERLRKAMDQNGTLSVLRNGFDVVGVRTTVKTAQFKPAFAVNPDILHRYEANRVRVIRQVHYSVHNELNIDLVLFLNGIPVATVELKTDFTQSIQDAIAQYRYDRIPNPKGQSAEPLLTFKRGALVHFAVSSSEVYMSTRLAGKKTRFLPFNLGNGQAAGNPSNPNGHTTAYLWERVWQRDSWLEILGRYLIPEYSEKKELTTIIFPRFHQLDVTRKLLSSVAEQGAGKKYLIQHSAGSGKTKSIAWTAHFFADLHDKHDKKAFDTVIVVSDRNVIDGQLSEAIEGMQRTKGVVANIKGTGGSKSAELAEALSGDKKIVVCTIQTFPFALEMVRELSATDDKRFAVIADEAHSSQTGTAAAKLKEVLNAEELAELEDGGEVSTDDVLAAQMANRADDDGITYVAFTATPKAKTLEIFGQLPDPSKPKGDDNLPEPFHVYSMQQAIEEEFILDVLQNYTTYKRAFKLATGGEEFDQEQVEKSAAMRKLMRWVSLHPYNISQKVQIVVEHYLQNVAHLINGKAKAMVVVGSRVEAVRWQIAINKYIKTKGYRIKSLVAFSGKVVDRESGPEDFTEVSRVLNDDIVSRDFREEFSSDRYQILLVANKFQTGFDQPLLCAMYVDKKLAGIQAVQTLSRLNRCYEKDGVKKDRTYVLDFVNEPQEILEAFKTYFTTAELSDTTDPEIILTLRSKLDSTGYYDEPEIERVVNVVFSKSPTQGQLHAAIKPVAQRLLIQFKDAKEQLDRAKERGNAEDEQSAKDKIDALILFRADMQTYRRSYTFLSQIFDYGNTDFEKRAIFFRYLNPILEFGREREEVDLSQVVLGSYGLRDQGNQTMDLRTGEKPVLDPMGEVGTGMVREKERVNLSEVIKKINDLFEGDLTDTDKLVYVRDVLVGKLLESETLVNQAKSNSHERFFESPDLDKELVNAIIESEDAHQRMSEQALTEGNRSTLKELLILLDLYERLRQKGTGPVQY